ncbi:hypothetical protein A3D03_02580 [Candidatus Gottesmanbacteria bacterium RIFCSPHIGHO2_02_FULL_40_13]|uniref:D-alanyl-D-alanine carboxypeptidase-like core domain-containing protein n=1 Tax=Candidatus Gottesmanbacteria bacterium RIFCSPHIGHO2_02_FULL_40_13 TaxID=1798384 RepID=A0A1F6A8R0_9BACT|nr:MAG: hypothetical protein A3D03_02580 [Candidatus Gottesmanbacteria bacterium RIFCSPHIGHO2_02_FULL_40_13]
MLIFVFLVSLSGTMLIVSSSRAGAEEIKTIKLGILTPPPTRIPPATIIPTVEEEDNPQDMPDQNDPDYQTCSDRGAGLYTPQPSLLEREFCSDKRVAFAYGATWTPPKLVNAKNKLGAGDYWVWQPEIKVREEIIDPLRDLLKAVDKSGCTAMLAYGFRSFETQQEIWENKGCAQNPDSCGVETPGWSTHQSGSAVDLYCAVLTDGNLVDFFEVPQTVISNAQKYGFIHAYSWDTPHFIAL